MRTQRGLWPLLRALIACLVLLPVAAAQAEDRFFDSDGVKIRYVVEGKGDPLVLIHGFTSDFESNWGVVAKRLAASYQVIGLDCRGHGKSGKPHDPAKYGPNMGDDVVRLLDHLKIRRAHVAGYSMGAFIAYELAFRHPERFLTLTLGAGGGIGQANTGALMNALAESLEQGKGFGPLITVLTPPGQPRPTEEQIRVVNQMLSARNDVKALAAVVRGGLTRGPALSKEQMEAKLKAWPIPTLALVGSQDPLKAGLDALKTRMEALRGAKSPVKLVVLEGANHMNAPSLPAFAKSMEEFLSAHATHEKVK